MNQNTPNRSRSVGSRVAERKAAQKRARMIMLAVAGIVVVVVVLVVILSSGGDKSSSTTTIPADPAAVLKAITDIPASVYDTVGVGDANGAPTAFQGTALTKDGKPELLYFGAEYCPFCAAERWAMVAALSRFGTFSNLSLSHSASDDIYPNTQTFSFYGSTYTSDYVVFTPVETATNEKEGGNYKPLQTPTAEQIQAAEETGQTGIPLMNFGGKYFTAGATYSPGVLEERSATAIAQAMADPNTTIGRAAIGAANGITAAICKMTNNQPAAVCDSAAVKAVALA